MAYFGGEVYSHCPVVSRSSLVSHYSVPVATVHDSNTMDCHGVRTHAPMDCHSDAMDCDSDAMDCDSDAMDCDSW